MKTLEQLLAERDALVTRIGSQRSMVSAGGRTVQYDQALGKDALAILDNEIARVRSAQGGVVPARFVRLIGRSGY